ncbi:MAG: hypothetical protein K9J48_01585 [Desulfohalobiaceae bacterium]|nr:hypothetical protein [Desulfohalobiaceae bacterium]
MKRAILVFCLPVVLLLGMCCELRAEKPWGATLIYGQLTQNHFEKIFYTRSRLEERFMLAGMLRRELGAVQEAIGWAPEDLFLDAELGLGYKWGDWKGIDQRFQEAVLSANLRYDLGSNPLGLSSISLGNGVSWTTKKPEYEEEITLNEKNSRLLYYLMVETAFHVPYVSDWELVLRVHHRSGGYGTFSGVRGGSNYLCFGLRHHFSWF